MKKKLSKYLKTNLYFSDFCLKKNGCFFLMICKAFKPVCGGRMVKSDRKTKLKIRDT